MNLDRVESIRRGEHGYNTDLIYRGNKALHGRVFFGSCEEVVESRRCDDAGHDALVVPKEYKP